MTPRYPVARTLADAELERLLQRSWNEINQELSRLAEDDLSRLIELERAGRHRAHLLIRIHQRYSAVRRERERHELLSQRGGSPEHGTTED